MSSAFEVASTGLGQQRTRRVIAGAGMVTPTKTLTVKSRGRTEVLEPERNRLAPDHELVCQRPDLFRAADPDDRITRDRHRERVGRSGEVAAVGRSRRRSKAEPWRL